MEISSFAMDANVLESNLFMSQHGKKAKNQLCPNYLPHLFQYVKTLLSEAERNSLKEYEVQVFIIETAIGQVKFTDLNVLCDLIIKEIRADIKYWIKGTEPFMKIYENMKKIGENDEKLDSVVLSMKEENENAFNEYRDYHEKLINLTKEEVKDGATKENKDKFETAVITDEVIRPSVEEYIPPKMNFNYEIYDVAVDSYYQNKTETFSKKVRTRWQDRRDKRLLDYPHEVVKNYVNIFKEVRDNDPNFANSIFVCNRNMKIPRIDIQLFPIIFQFLMKKHDIDIKVKTGHQVFLFQRVQNIIYLCLMTDDKTYAFSSHRIYKGAFLDNLNTHRGMNDLEDAHEEHEEDRKMEEEEDGMHEENPEENSMTPGEENANSVILTDFKQFSYQNGIDVDALFSIDRESKPRKFNLLNNALRICAIFVDKLGKWELSVIPTLDAQDATFDNFKMRELINRLDDSEFFSDNILESIIDYYHLEFEHKNILQYIEGLQQYRAYSLRCSTTKGDKEDMQGVFSDKKFCNFAMDRYQNYFNSPTIAKKRSYIFHTSCRKKFSPEECKKFLEGLHKYFETPINNKKIAKHIGPHIKSNHVRFIKGRYLRKLRKRAKAENITMLDLLKDQINTNNIKEVAESL